jgi:hypothetical protein
LVLLILTAGLLNGCDPKIEHPEQFEHCDNKRNFKEFASNSEFPYSISETKKDLLARNFSSLSLDLDQKQVATLLGEPTFRELKHAGMGNPPPIFGCVWVWELRKLTPRKEASNSDQSIEIWFNADGSMSWAAPRNIPGLKTLEKKHQDR